MNNEYITLYLDYSQTYGPKTAIFLQIGSFFELLDEIAVETGESRANVREIADLLGLQTSIKRNPAGTVDEVMAGFPDYALHRWASRLTSLGWTVVVLEQEKDVRGKIKGRHVSRILSPATHLENISSTDIPYVVSLVFESRGAHLPPQYGVAALDLTTGTTHSYANVCQGRADVWTADDLQQFLSVYAPKELVVDCIDLSSLDATPLRRQFGLPDSLPLHVRHKTTHGSLEIDLVRTEYLQKVYAIRSLLPPRTYLGIRSDAEETALLLLLQFVEEHYPGMIKSLHRNQAWIPALRLICGNHALTQLQMTGAQSNETVMGLFDKAITPMGKRAMKERLVMPYSTATDIRMRLTEVEAYLGWEAPKRAQLERQLRYMYDLPRLHRRVLCGLIALTEIAHLVHTYRAMESIQEDLVTGTPLEPSFSREEWRAYRAVFAQHFSEEKAFQVSADVTPFHPTLYPAIASAEQDIRTHIEAIHQLRETLAAFAAVPIDSIRVEEREKEPYGFKCSSVVLQQIKRRLGKEPDAVKGLRVSELKSGGWIDCTALQERNTSLQKAREHLIGLVRIHLVEACTALSMAGESIWVPMEQWVSHVDATQCIGSVAMERGWIKPEVEDTDDAHAAELAIEQMRHPLVEAIQTRTAYVKHDVTLSSEQKEGWLLYGLNASGKTTTMKAVGLCVLLAQAGCYVPAKSMYLRPFQAVYTRILNQDNLFAGLSSFAVEMSELRDILQHANANTLVLGDELCSGTESVSAQALVVSGMEWLTARRAKFIFASHLHDLPRWLSPTATQRIAVWHLHVEYDPVREKLIYDRTLRPGSGSTLYGLEVAKAMDLPAEFLRSAIEIRRTIQGSTTEERAPTSSWNSNVTRQRCEVCGSRLVSDLEVHHRIPRSMATNGKLPDGSMMNDPRNLVVLCEACHDRVHSGAVTLGDVRQTSHGPERVIHTSDPGTSVAAKGLPSVAASSASVAAKGLPSAAASSASAAAQPAPFYGVTPVDKRGKWTPEEWVIIRNTLKSYTSLSLKSIRGYLASMYGIEISETVLSKTKKGL